MCNTETQLPHSDFKTQIIYYCVIIDWYATDSQPIFHRRLIFPISASQVSAGILDMNRPTYCSTCWLTCGWCVNQHIHRHVDQLPIACWLILGWTSAYRLIVPYQCWYLTEGCTNDTRSFLCLGEGEVTANGIICCLY